MMLVSELTFQSALQNSATDILSDRKCMPHGSAHRGIVTCRDDC